MNFLKRLFGTNKPLCPYCSFEFEEMPKRKRKCPECKEPIYRKRRPSEKNVRLVTKTEAKEIDQIWDDRYIAGRKETLQDTINEGQVNLNAGRLAMYTSSRRAQAEIFELDEEFEKALLLYFEVLYFEANGVNNHGGFDGSGSLAPGTVYTCRDLIESLRLNDFQAHKLFTTAATPVQGEFNPPKNPTEVWLDEVKPKIYEKR